MNENELQFENEIKRIEKSARVMIATVDAMEEISELKLSISMSDIQSAYKSLSGKFIEFEKIGELGKSLSNSSEKICWDYGLTIEKVTGFLSEQDRLKTVRGRSKHRGKRAKINFQYWRESQSKAKL